MGETIYEKLDRLGLAKSTIGGLVDEIDQLRTRIAALEADNKRLEWETERHLQNIEDLQQDKKYHVNKATALEAELAAYRAKVRRLVETSKTAAEILGSKNLGTIVNNLSDRFRQAIAEVENEKTKKTT